MPLNDRKLVEKAGEIKDLQARIDKLKEKADTLKTQVANELDRRGTKMIEAGGYRITLVQNEYVKYDVDALAGEVTPSKLKKVTQRVIDKAKLSLAVQAGEIDPEVVAKCSEVTYSKAFPKITEVAG